MIGRGVLTAPAFIGPFCLPVDAKSTAQPWHSDPSMLERDERSGVLIGADGTREERSIAGVEGQVAARTLLLQKLHVALPRPRVPCSALVDFD